MTTQSIATKPIHYMFDHSIKQFDLHPMVNASLFYLAQRNMEQSLLTFIPTDQGAFLVDQNGELISEVNVSLPAELQVIIKEYTDYISMTLLVNE